MSVTKAISNSLYNYLDKNGLVTDSDRIKYSLDYICASVTKIAAVLIVGAVTGTLLEVTTSMLVFGLLRQYSGGAHMGNEQSCLFVMLRVISLIK
ncbi:MAG: accessory gene regulator B family protein [Anaerovoracaceae bacterium]|jgi:accessory gene regulator protein AgrB